MRDERGAVCLPTIIGDRRRNRFAVGRFHEQFVNRCSDSIGVAFDNPPGSGRFHHLARTACVCDDQRRSTGKRLYPGICQAFAGRRQNGDIGGLQIMGNLGMRHGSKEVDTFGNAQLVGQFSKHLLVFAFAN